MSGLRVSFTSCKHEALVVRHCTVQLLVDFSPCVFVRSMFDVCISSGSLCVFPSMVRLHELFNWKCAFSDTAGTEALSQPQLTPFWKSFRLRGQAVNCLVFSSSLLNNEGNPIIPSISNCDTKHQLKGKLSPAIGPVVLVCGHIPD